MCVGTCGVCFNARVCVSCGLCVCICEVYLGFKARVYVLCGLCVCVYTCGICFNAHVYVSCGCVCVHAIYLFTCVCSICLSVFM